MKKLTIKCNMDLCKHRGDYVYCIEDTEPRWNYKRCFFYNTPISRGELEINIGAMTEIPSEMQRVRDYIEKQMEEDVK